MCIYLYIYICPSVYDCTRRNFLERFFLFSTAKERATVKSMSQFEKQKEQGNSLFKQGLYREAVHCYDQLIAAQPQNPVGYSNKAMALIKLGEYTQAIQMCQQGLRYTSTAEHVAIRSKLQYRLELAQGAVGSVQIPVVEVDELPEGYDRS